MNDPDTAMRQVVIQHSSGTARIIWLHEEEATLRDLKNAVQEHFGIPHHH